MKISRPGCATPIIPRPAQPHPNAPPGASKEAATAAKKDVAKRDGGVVGALKAAYAKITAAAPKQGSDQSAKALADRRDQEKRLKKEY